MNLNSSYNKFEPFTYKTLSDLEKNIKSLNLDIPISSEVEILQQRIKLKNRFIPNRLAIQPMEGVDSLEDGSPSKLTLRRYERFARGGAGLIWFEATALNNECRSNIHQLMLSEENIAQFKEIVSKTREWSNKALNEMGFKDKSVLILQLNHSGRYSRRNGKKFPIRAFHNNQLDDAIRAQKEWGTIISDNELERLEDIWVKKAILAREVGFDGVDIKSCHGYLISELLASRIREDSKYGGKSLENRTQFFLNIIRRIKEELHNTTDFLITTRLGVYDGVPYPNGFGVQPTENEAFPASINISEPLQLIKKLYDLGLRLINITAGNPHHEPHITRPYNMPIKGEENPSEHPLYGVSRIINLASSIKEHAPQDMVVIGSGYSYLRQYAGHVAAGLIHRKNIDICGFGRMAIANPDFPKQIFQEGIIAKKKSCITCSKCSGVMRQGKNMGCVIRDPLYKDKT